MKITKTQLKKIIREEVEKTMSSGAVEQYRPIIEKELEKQVSRLETLFKRNIDKGRRPKATQLGQLLSIKHDISDDPNSKWHAIGHKQLIQQFANLVHKKIHFGNLIELPDFYSPEREEFRRLLHYDPQMVDKFSEAIEYLESLYQNYP